MSKPRYTASTITDDALDKLYENASRGWRRGDQWKERALEAEASADRAAFVAEAEAKLTAGCPDHGPNGGWLMTCQCEAIGVLRDLAAEAPTTTKPETES